MRENQRHTVPAFFLKCAVLQPLNSTSRWYRPFTTIRICTVLQPQMALQTTEKILT